MPYSGLMPSMEAIQQALREPLSKAPTDHNRFAIYIFERAREIDHEQVLASKISAQREQPGCDVSRRSNEPDLRPAEHHRLTAT
jgi:hypothetical protein